MFIIDTKDFRKLSSYDVEVNDTNFATALTATGTDLTAKPLQVRVRIKDADPRRYGYILCKQEIVDKDGCEFRLNVYCPPAWAIGNWDEFRHEVNSQILHDICHMSQVREIMIPAGPDHEWTTEDHEKWESAATEAEQSNLQILAI